MESYFSLLLVLLSPILVAACGMWFLRWKEGEHRRKSPISRKVCRYPGYTLTKEIESLDERLSTDLIVLFMIPAVTIGISSIGLLELSGVMGWVVFGTFYVVGIGIAISRLFRTARSLRAKRLGLAGEQVVGHQLAELYRAGFFVFHDFPLDFGNIDHIAVGPPGVFAIETKFKRKTKDEKDGHKMSYDEAFMHFPNGKTRKPLDQVQRAANDLRGQIGRLFGDTPVIPVVVLPGWFVERRAAKTSVQVMNDKQLIGWLSKEERVLDDQKIQRVAAFIEEKCRDVSV